VRPDLVFIRPKVAVFVDGCFWHCCPEHGSMPVGNHDFWEPKLRRNVERDRNADALLAASGWGVLRVWEHEPSDVAARRVADVVRGARPPAQSFVK
jgi:DNA mismatch endonuclease (patch repair protein)